MAGIRPGPLARVAWRDRRVTATEAVQPSDDILLVDTTSGNVTLTLPLAATVRGQWYEVKKLVAANTVTLDPAGGETIEGAATLAWTAQYQAYTVYSDGTEWWIV
jgi:hypothetical protein